MATFTATRPSERARIRAARESALRASHESRRSRSVAAWRRLAAAALLVLIAGGSASVDPATDPGNGTPPGSHAPPGTSLVSMPTRTR